MKPVKNDPQAIGSAITYQRRYSIGSILNLNIDNDDDGNKASIKTEQEQQKTAVTPKPSITPKLMEKMKERIKNGEKGIVFKAEQSFILTPEQKNELVELYTQQENE